MASIAFLRLFFRSSQMVQKKHTMKCAGVAGRRVRSRMLEDVETVATYDLSP